MELIAEMQTRAGEVDAAGAGSRKAQWTGRIMSGLVIVFLTLDAAAKLARLPPVLEGTAKLGYPTTVVFGLGAVLLAGVAVHAIPRTALLGAIVLTGYLGGAVATHVRVGDPLLTHTLFPVYVGILMWGGLTLRDARLRAALWARG